MAARALAVMQFATAAAVTRQVGQDVVCQSSGPGFGPCKNKQARAMSQLPAEEYWRVLPRSELHVASPKRTAVYPPPLGDSL
eukprot:8003246-Pyramimonas_sp.AAC.1